MWSKKINDSEDFYSTIYELNETDEVIGSGIPKEYPCIMVCDIFEGLNGVYKVDYMLIYKSDF